MFDGPELRTEPWGVICLSLESRNSASGEERTAISSRGRRRQIISISSRGDEVVFEKIHDINIIRWCEEAGEQLYIAKLGTWSSVLERGASQVALVVKNPPANAGEVRDVGLIPGSGRSPGGGHGNPFRYFCLGNPMDRGAWQAPVHGVAKSQTRLKRFGMHTHARARRKDPLASVPPRAWRYGNVCSWICRECPLRGCQPLVSPDTWLL